jgi:hypothetical protein
MCERSLLGLSHTTACPDAAEMLLLRSPRPPVRVMLMSVNVCLLLQDLLQSCVHARRGTGEDMCYEN